MMISSKLLSGPIKGTIIVPSRPICHKSKLKPKKNNYHWPYDRRSWGLLNWYLDWDTKGKFDENTKIVQVEGNISAGKEEFAKKLADELGMAYFPQVDLESYYINRHGFDYRALNPLLPERLRLCDWEMYHENPSRHSVVHMQHHLFKMRAFHYWKAVSHLFNTGQGVVLTRSVFTERGIVEAMHNIGWLPKGYLRGDGVRFYDWMHRYNYIRNMLLAKALKPHLTIYLDTPVDTCLDRIKNDPDPMIANSNALDRKFLEEVETAFKDVVLPKQDHHGHVMVVDHPEHKSSEEIQDVIDDIEELDFSYDHHDSKFETWNNKLWLNWHFEMRRKHSTCGYAFTINKLVDQPWYDIAGLGDSITNSDLVLRRALFQAHVGPVGSIQNYWTDAKIHGFPVALFGKWQNFSERLDSKLRSDYT